MELESAWEGPFTVDQGGPFVYCGPRGATRFRSRPLSDSARERHGCKVEALLLPVTPLDVPAAPTRSQSHCLGGISRPALAPALLPPLLDTGDFINSRFHPDPGLDVDSCCCSSLVVLSVLAWASQASPPTDPSLESLSVKILRMVPTVCRTLSDTQYLHFIRILGGHSRCFTKDFNEEPLMP